MRGADLEDYTLAMRMLSIIVSACLASACGSAGGAPDPAASDAVVTASDRPDQTAPQQVPDGVPIASAEELAGEYRVAGIDDAALDAPIGIALSISESEIEYEGACGGYAWSYTLDAGALETTATREPDTSCLASALIHHAVFDTAEAIGAATYVERTQSNGIRLSGGGRSITLFSQ